MVQFTSVALDLQIKIAEKIAYFDQIEFQLASKHGRDVMKLTKIRAVVNVEQISQDDRGPLITIKEMVNSEQPRINWSQMSEFTELPRLNVEWLWLTSELSLNAFEEINEKAGIVTGNTKFSWLNKASFSVQDFNQIATMFHISSFTTRTCHSEVLFSSPKFQEIDDVSAYVRDIPDTVLIQLKATKMTLTGYISYSFVNQLLEEWIQHKREIESIFCHIFGIESPVPDRGDRVFRNLPFTVLGQCPEDQEIQKFEMEDIGDSNSNNNKQFSLYKDDVAALINRGEKNMIVIVHENGKYVSLEEFPEQKQFHRYEKNEDTF